MSKVVPYPPIYITKGIEFFEASVFAYDNEGADPVNLTDWTGTFALSRRPFDKPFYSGDCVLGGAAGTIEITIPVEDIADFEANPILGGSPVASFQIYLVAPDPTQNQVWQGPANIAGLFKP